MNAGGKRAVLRLLGIGWYVALCIFGGGYGGNLLDRWADSSPVLTLVGLGLGIAVALIGMFRMIMAVLQPESGEDRD